MWHLRHGGNGMLDSLGERMSFGVSSEPEGRSAGVLDVEPGVVLCACTVPLASVSHSSFSLTKFPSSELVSIFRKCSDAFGPG